MPATTRALSFSEPPASTMPVPSGFERTRASPARAPPFTHTRSGCTKPCTARPKIGSSERMVWPPATTPPASATTAAAAVRIAPTASTGIRSGKAEMLSAKATVAPMANTSLHALAAATAPKSAGSSTSGGKKSVVATTARSSLTR